MRVSGSQALARERATRSSSLASSTPRPDVRSAATTHSRARLGGTGSRGGRGRGGGEAEVGAGGGAGGRGGGTGRGGSATRWTRAGRDAIERDAHDEHGAQIVAARHELLGEADHAEPRASAEVGRSGVGAEAHGGDVFRVEVAVGEPVLERVLAEVEEWVGPGRGGEGRSEHQEHRDEEGNGTHGPSLIKVRAAPGPQEFRCARAGGAVLDDQLGVP